MSAASGSSGAAAGAGAVRSAATWTRVGGDGSRPAGADARAGGTAPAARSGHAMTFLPPTQSVLLFGGADGNVFFEDVHVLEPKSYAASDVSRRRRSDSTSYRRSSDVNDSQSATTGESLASDLEWKRLVVSQAPASSASPRSQVSSSGASVDGSALAGTKAQPVVLPHTGGGRDYHTMHYVKSSPEDERTRGLRVLVLGNVVVAADEEETSTAAYGGRGTQPEGGNGGAQTFAISTLRVEELRVKQPSLEAQWSTQRVDSASLWKPRARHAHCSVAVGRDGDQIFVFGGKSAASGAFFNDLFYYDAPLNQWVKPAHISGRPPQPRAFAGLTASEDGRTLFLFGGTDGRQEFGSLFVFDMHNARWDSLAGATTGEKPSCRINHSLSFAQPHHLVVFGGRRRATRQNELYVYDVVSRSWRLVQGEQGGRSTQTGDTAVWTPPVGRTAHAAVMYRSEATRVAGTQQLLIFGGYAGSHRWLNDLYVVSLSSAVLSSPATSARAGTRITRTTSSRYGMASQRTRSSRDAVNIGRITASARVSLSAPQHPARASQQSSQLPSQHTMQQSSQQAPLTSQPPAPAPAPAEQTASESEPTAEPPVVAEPRASIAAPSRSDPANPSTGGSAGVLTDITNHSTASIQPPQPEAPQPSTAIGSSLAEKKRKRRRLADSSQDSTNSIANSSGSSLSSSELTSAQVAMQTAVLQILQHQKPLEDGVNSILTLLTKEQSARQKQSLTQEAFLRLSSEDQSRRLDAAARRNEALEGRLARAEADKAALREKLAARETELYMHKHGLESALPPLGARVEAIEASHKQQLTTARVIESKISAVHDILDELRHAGGDCTESDDSPEKRAGLLDASVATQPTPSPPRLLYPQRIVLALEEKLRNVHAEKEVLEAKLKAMAERLEHAEGKASEARRFFLTWCQGDSPRPTSQSLVAPAAASSTSAPTSVHVPKPEDSTAPSASDGGADASRM